MNQDAYIASVHWWRENKERGANYLMDRIVKTQKPLNLIIIMSRYMDIINGKVGVYAEARRKWKRRLKKYIPKT
jgi:hypothetical protein